MRRERLALVVATTTLATACSIDIPRAEPVDWDASSFDIDGAALDATRGDASADAATPFDWSGSIAVGNNITCVRDGTDLRCWGDASYGTLGYSNQNDIGDDEPASAGGVVVVGGDVLGVSGHYHGICTVLVGGGLRCWGDGAVGIPNAELIGDDEFPADADPVDVGFATKMVSAGQQHTCAVSIEGEVRCWGFGDYGQLGYGNVDYIGNDEHPSQVGVVSVGGPVDRVVACGEHTCALLASGDVKCWGENGSGQLGYGNTTNVGDVSLPSSVGTVSLGGKVADLACGTGHTCVVLEGGNVRCWGVAGAQLGYGNPDDPIGDNELPSSVGPVSLGSPAVQITAGEQYTCALLSNATVRCWGLGYYGRLGYGDTDAIGDDELPTSLDPVDVGGPVVEVRAGFTHTCARMEDGAVRCWGRGNSGALGHGSTSNIGDNESPASAGDVPYL